MKNKVLLALLAEHGPEEDVMIFGPGASISDITIKPIPKSNPKSGYSDGGYGGAIGLSPTPTPEQREALKKGKFPR